MMHYGSRGANKEETDSGGMTAGKADVGGLTEANCYALCFLELRPEMTGKQLHGNSSLRNLHDRLPPANPLDGKRKDLA
jgi:hypothetical protein